MSYVGKGPIDRVLGISQKDTFTGDGSTVNFDMTSAAPEGGDTAVDVFVDNVRQEPGTGKAYVLAQDGSGDYKRITFSTAPANGATIWTNNRLRTQITNIMPGAGTVTSTHLAANSVDSSELVNGSVDLAHMSVNSIDSDQYVDASIDFAHIQNVAANSILGRNANSSGVLSEIALADTQLLIGDGTGFTAASLSGDVTMANTGAVTIANNAVGLAEMAGLARGSIIVGDASGDPSALVKGTSEQVLRVNTAGTDLEYADAVGGAAWGLKTSAYTAVAGDGVLVDTDSSAITITLPVSSGPPSLGDFVRVLDATGNAATNNITVARNGNNIQGAAADLTIATNRAAIGLVYVNATEGWVLIEN